MVRIYCAKLSPFGYTKPPLVIKFISTEVEKQKAVQHERPLKII
jgi:hypothetical protein